MGMEKDLPTVFLREFRKEKYIHETWSPNL